MKRKIAMLLASTMLLTAGWTNCVQAAENPEHVIVTFVYATVEPKDLLKVQDAVNEITVPEINVEVEFKPISLADSFSNYSLWISSGEQVDLMCLLAQDIRQYVSTGQLEPLDEWITEENAPTTLKLMDEFNIAGKVNGETYGLSSVYPCYGWQPGLIIRDEWLQEVDYEEKDIYTLDDITDIFAAVKEKHPDVYPYGPLVNGISNGGSGANTLMDFVTAGSTTFSGALTDKESEVVENFFETEEYKTYLQTMADWYEAGYIMPDAATTDLSVGELLKNGKVASFSNEQSPQQFGAESYGFKLSGLPTGENHISGVDGIYWSVPITSESPESAVRLLDLIYENSDLMNLIMRGIEGEHWVMVDEKEGFIDYPEGIDATNTPYLNLFGVWGDRRNEYNFNHEITKEANENYTAAAMENKYKNYGFTFDDSSVSNQVLACQSVADQYQKALETGSLGNEWEETYNKMLGELETAGIDDIIAECQAQLDAFLGK